MDLNTPVGELGLTFRLKKSALQRLNIETLEDLLFHLPFRYEDFTNVVKIRSLKIDEQSVIRGRVIDIKNEYTKKRFVLQKAQLLMKLAQLYAHGSTKLILHELFILGMK